MKNKLAKQSYFIKRLRDSGYSVAKIFDKYSTTDSRAWTILINPSDASVYCTCYCHHGEAMNVNEDSMCYFEFYDGGQFIPSKIKIDTNSLEVIISRLIKFGVEPIITNQQKHH